MPPAPGKEDNYAKEKERSLHVNGSEENIDLILRTIISVNQLSTHGALSDLFKELSKASEVAGKLAARLNVNSNNFLKTRSYPNCATALV